VTIHFPAFTEQPEKQANSKQPMLQSRPPPSADYDVLMVLI